MTRRAWVGLVALGLVLGLARVARADGVQGGDILGISSDPIKSVTVTSQTASAGDFRDGSLILGFKLYANDAGDYCGLYDTDSILGTVVTALLDEWVEATDEETNVHMWPRPMKLTTDLTILTNGVCTVYYQ